MTVCIAAICCKSTDPKVIVAADRMVTKIIGSPIEYEHTSTKMSQLMNNCIIMSAGSVPLIEELTYRIKTGIVKMRGDTGDKYISIRDVTTVSIEAYQEMIRDFIERHILSTYNMDIEEFKKQERYNEGFLAGLNQQIVEIRREIENNLISLITGVDEEGAHIYGIRGGNFLSFNTIGYQAIGSGESPAESVFIHNKYDTNWDLEKALITVVEAKKQAEEAQGVGRETDISIITKDRIYVLPKEKINKLESVLEIVKSETSRIRNKILEENKLEINLEE